jgi:hypothetical protein
MMSGQGIVYLTGAVVIGYLVLPIIACWLLFGYAAIKGWSRDDITPEEIMRMIAEERSARRAAELAAHELIARVKQKDPAQCSASPGSEG